MHLISSTVIDAWERFYRANFINSLTGFKSVSLIATVDKEGQPNLGIYSSLVHIGSNPPLVGYINRPRTANQHTLANIESTGVYTINHIHPGFLEKAHQSSAKYPEQINEFAETGLTPEFTENQIAPFVKESLIKYALSLEDIIPIPANDTYLVIGRIQYVLLEPSVLSADGFLQLDKSASVCSNGNDAYYLTQLIGRYQYARPDLPTQKLL